MYHFRENKDYASAKLKVPYNACVSALSPKPVMFVCLFVFGGINKEMENKL